MSTLYALAGRLSLRCALFPLLISALAAGARTDAAGTEMPSQAAVLPATDPSPRFDVTSYVVADNGLLPTNIWVPILAKYTGPDVSLQEIVKGATELQSEYLNRGHLSTSVAIAPDQITDGIVTLNIFQTAIPQIVVSGVRYYCPTSGGLASALPAIAPVLAPAPPGAPGTNAAPRAAARPPKPASPAQIKEAYAALVTAMAEAEKAPDTRIHVVSTNAGPRFDVQRYRITGNTILSPQDMATILTNIDGAYGTNVSIDGVRTVVEQLQAAYRDRGYVTVAVGLPQQKLTNATVKVQVTEGVLSAIDVEGNRYFSSNNVMRALPSLHTNMLLNADILQAELNRANANRDRQIYPVIGPGPEPGTSALTLHVKDQLPVHAKLDFDNQYSPGTPELRVNASAEDDNLWQQEHSLGVQYGFSPEMTKLGPQWNFYDEPAVADYSAFYRLPLGPPESLESDVEKNPAKFGFNEATRQFNLPPASAQPTLNVYASRATIDTGIVNLFDGYILYEPGTNEVQRQTVQEGITINEDIGFQLSKPLPPIDDIASTISGGLDFKIYSQQNTETNFFNLINFTPGPNGNLIPGEETDVSAYPGVVQTMRYLPLQLGYNADWNNSAGPGGAAMSASANLWFSSATTYPGGTNSPLNIYGVKSLQGITQSGDSTGHWVILRPSFWQDIVLAGNWVTIFRADGQWASEPLISNEQFGIGGVNSVRGYHEGEIFGDTGWHVSLEEDTPTHRVGTVYDGQSLTLQGRVYFDAATAYRLDPPAGVDSSSKLAGTGFGFNAMVGPHWGAEFLFSLPLFDTPITTRYQPYFNFAVTGQF